MRKNKQKRFGLFYRSNGRWTGPYNGVTFTVYTINRNPIKQDIQNLKNHVLKSAIQLREVKTA